jgi:flavin reductase (DIM6/NTAB) family NADH-FMN oxidoreductase RutF
MDVLENNQLNIGNTGANDTFIDSETFRNVMRKLAGSVTVVTTEGDGTFHGFTATAVCSVCAEPRRS